MDPGDKTRVIWLNTSEAIPASNVFIHYIHYVQAYVSWIMGINMGENVLFLARGHVSKSNHELGTKRPACEARTVGRHRSTTGCLKYVGANNTIRQLLGSSANSSNKSWQVWEIDHFEIEFWWRTYDLFNSTKSMWLYSLTGLVISYNYPYFDNKTILQLRPLQR